MISTIAAIPVAMLAVRYDRMRARLLERSTYLVLAMPGLVIALALSYFTERYLNSFGYQSAPLLILAYAILFFPLALVGVRASVAYAPVEFEEAARSLGQSRRRHALSRDAQDHRTRTRGVVLPGLSRRGHRVDGDVAAGPDQRADPVDAVLGLRDRTSPTVRRRRSPWRSSSSPASLPIS